MKYCHLCIIIFGFTTSLYAADNDKSQLEALHNLGTAKTKNTGRIFPNPGESVASLLLGAAKKEEGLSANKQAGFYCRERFYAFYVAFEFINGFKYHVADYYDGTRVVTCLNGPCNGLQTIYLRGFWVAESGDVTWHRRYFVHWHISGRITSYDYKQVIELY